MLDLLDPAEVNQRASIPPPGDEEFDNALLVEGSTAVTLIMSMNVKEILRLRKSFLRKLRPEVEGDCETWERFVVIRADGHEGTSMYPRLLPGATVLIDGHYNSLKPYREMAGNNLVLRPHNRPTRSKWLPWKRERQPPTTSSGRVCYVGIET